MTDQQIHEKRKLLPALDAVKQHTGIPTIVCLCGSTKFYQQYVQANFDFTMQGKIVLSVGFYHHALGEAHGETVGITPAEKGFLDELHKRKIDLADEVFVINVGGYIGDSTRSEIEYARLLHKPITYLYPNYLSTLDRECDADPKILENIRKEAGAEICYICLEIGSHTTKEHQVHLDYIPATSTSKRLEWLQKDLSKLADAMADQPEGYFNAPEWYNLHIIDRAAACIERFKKATRTFWQPAEGCKTMKERQERLNKDGFKAVSEVTNVSISNEDGSNKTEIGNGILSIGNKTNDK
jgi:hypothetical protein